MTTAAIHTNAIASKTPTFSPFASASPSDLDKQREFGPFMTPKPAAEFMSSWAGLRSFIWADDWAGAADRADDKQIFLFCRLRLKLDDMNPKIPRMLRDALLPKLLSGELHARSQSFGLEGVRELRN